MDVPAALDEDAFRAFFERHHAELARFAWMLVGERTAAEDIAADAMLAVWRQWDQARRARSQIAYARGIVANLAKTRIRAAVRERRRNTLFWQKPTETADGPDTAAVIDVRAALDRLPCAAAPASSCATPSGSPNARPPTPSASPSAPSSPRPPRASPTSAASSDPHPTAPRGRRSPRRWRDERRPRRPAPRPRRGVRARRRPHVDPRRRRDARAPRGRRRARARALARPAPGDGHRRGRRPHRRSRPLRTHPGRRPLRRPRPGPARRGPRRPDLRVRSAPGRHERGVLPDGPSGTGSSAEGETETEETPEQPDWLWSEGAIDANNTDYWTQSVVRFRSDTALTGLEVELRLTEDEGLAFLDAWTSDDNLFTEAVYTSEDGYAVLRWTLKDGAVVPAGNEYTLAGQFDPNGGPRSGEGDAFTITATGEDGETGVLEGGF
nr:hypothetical protein GCM10025732_08210 [Glycomyces mayteni]